MKDIIKEIIDYIDDRVIPNEKWNAVKEYMKELQEENKRLKFAMKDTYDSANDTCSELQQRIDKAIEYCENNLCHYWAIGDYIKKPYYLINILKGSDK